MVDPELMPRALFWFRWGAAWTWITGFLLLGLIYYQTKTVLFDQDHIGNPWLWLAIVLIALAVGFVIYNADHEDDREQGRRRRAHLSRALRRRLLRCSSASATSADARSTSTPAASSAR